MGEQSTSTMTWKRIIISLLIMVCIPLLAKGVNIYVKQEDMSMAFSINILVSILIMYDWNLFGIHYNRSKTALSDTFIYTLMGLLLMGILFWFSDNYMQVNFLLPSKTSFTNYPYAIPPMLIAYSFMQATMISIESKCLTDHFKLNNNEIQIILITGLLFGAVFTVLFVPYSLEEWLYAYIYYALQTMIMSYLYNQSNSFIPGLLSMGILYFVVQLI